MLVRHALGRLRFGFRRRQCGQEHRREDGDDCNHHQKLNQREATLPWWWQSLDRWRVVSVGTHSNRPPERLKVDSLPTHFQSNLTIVIAEHWRGRPAVGMTKV